MSRPRFSVVIPTRERAHTLRHCLKTCLDQDFTDYEIIVCDNHSSPATREVVAEANSPRVRYVRAPEPLAMSHNWELALSHAEGEYVTVLGDDDGLLSHGLQELDRVIRRTGARAVRWSAAFYLWPTVALEGEANFLAVPLSRELRTVEALPALAEVVNFRAFYTSLPMIYNSVIHRDLIAELRERTGKVFANNCPDVYSGFAFAYLVGSYVSVDVPMSVAGLSGGSNGVATLLLRRPSAVAQEFRQFNARSGLNVHPWVPDLPVYPAVPVADSFQFVREALFPNDDRLQLDRRHLASACVAALWAADADEWRARLGVIRATFADAPELQRWFDETHGQEPFRHTPQIPLHPAALGYDGSQLHLRADLFDVADVAGAARLCERILGYRGTEVVYDQTSQARLNGEVQRLQTEAAQAEARLAELQRGRARDVETLHALAAQLAEARQQLQGHSSLQEEAWRLRERLAVCETDRLAQTHAIHALNDRLGTCEADRAAQREALRTLTAQMAAGESARAAAEAARAASAAAHAASEADRAVRLEIINSLGEQLARERNTLLRRLRRAPAKLLRMLSRGRPVGPR
jgi:hypothetical protein